MEGHAFNDLKISNFKVLSTLSARSKCKNCGKSRMYYCYTCFLALPSLEGVVPTVDLPFEVDIIKHPGEVCGKSTAIHAAVLAPKHVHIHIYPDIPPYNPKKTVLIFPDKDAVTLKEFFALKYMNSTESTRCIKEVPSCLDDHLISSDETLMSLHNHGYNDSYYDANISHSKDNFLSQLAYENTDSKANVKAADLLENENIRFDNINEDAEDCFRIMENPIKKVVFIDCTWLQTHKIVTDARLLDLPRIKLDEYETKFWRYQRNKPPTYLSTIEAIYYFVREYSDVFIHKYSGNFDRENADLSVESSYNGQYDNLLFFFCFFYEKINKEAVSKGRVLKSYKQRCEYIDKGFVPNNLSKK